MRRLAAISFLAVSFLPSCTVLKSKPPKMPVCAVDDTHDVKATFLDNKSRQTIKVTRNSIIFSSPAVAGNSISVVEVSLERQVRERGELVAASITPAVVYFITEQGWLFRYGPLDKIPLKIADKRLDIDKYNVSINFLSIGNNELVVIQTNNNSYTVRYDPKVDAFFFQS